MKSAIFLAMLAITACSPMTYSHGIPNLVAVDGDYIYRSGQISSQEGWNYVKQLAHGRKVHLVKLNFDVEGSDAPGVAMGFDLTYVPIQPEGDQDLATDIWDAFQIPDGTNITSAKQVLRYCKEHPTTDMCDVHCTHGQDRTGEVVGEFRVDADGWTKPAAYNEMLDHHYHPELHGLHDRWESYQPPQGPASGVR